MKTAISSIENYVDEFRSAFQAGVQGICQAADVYVRVIDEDPDRIDEFHAAFSDLIPASAWKGFEAVGRKYLHPTLLMGGGGQNAAAIKRLPYSEQERVLNGHKYDLLTSDGDRLRVDLRHVTRDQAQQLFTEDHIRSEPEQKLWIERAKAINARHDPVVEVPYVISGSKVIFKARTAINKQELKRILMEL